MAKNLFVGSLPLSMREGALKDLFTQYGPVQMVTIIKDNTTGDSRGFAFVEMQMEEDATKAKETLHGSLIEGKTITVKDALAKPTYRPGPVDRRSRRYIGGKNRR